MFLEEKQSTDVVPQSSGSDELLTALTKQLNEKQAVLQQQTQIETEEANTLEQVNASMAQTENNRMAVRSEKLQQLAAQNAKTLRYATAPEPVKWVRELGSIFGLTSTAKNELAKLQHKTTDLQTFDQQTQATRESVAKRLSLFKDFSKERKDVGEAHIRMIDAELAARSTLLDYGTKALENARGKLAGQIDQRNEFLKSLTPEQLTSLEQEAAEADGGLLDIQGTPISVQHIRRQREANDKDNLDQRILRLSASSNDLTVTEAVQDRFINRKTLPELMRIMHDQYQVKDSDGAVTQLDPMKIQKRVQSLAAEGANATQVTAGMVSSIDLFATRFDRAVRTQTTAAQRLTSSFGERNATTRRFADIIAEKQIEVQAAVGGVTNADGLLRGLESGTIGPDQMTYANTVAQEYTQQLDKAITDSAKSIYSNEIDQQVFSGFLRDENVSAADAMDTFVRQALVATPEDAVRDPVLNRVVENTREVVRLKLEQALQDEPQFTTGMSITELMLMMQNSKTPTIKDQLDGIKRIAAPEAMRAAYVGPASTRVLTSAMANAPEVLRNAVSSDRLADMIMTSDLAAKQLKQREPAISVGTQAAGNLIRMLGSITLEDGTQASEAFISYMRSPEFRATVADQLNQERSTFTGYLVQNGAIGGSMHQYMNNLADGYLRIQASIKAGVEENKQQLMRLSNTPKGQAKLLMTLAGSLSANADPASVKRYVDTVFADDKQAEAAWQLVQDIKPDADSFREVRKAILANRKQAETVLGAAIDYLANTQSNTGGHSQFNPNVGQPKDLQNAFEEARLQQTVTPQF